jgi:glycosyltransferase involved in cell wall biosynthesis
MNILYIVNVDWFFISHRLPIAVAAKKKGYEVHIATKITKYKSQLESYGFKVHELEIHRSETNILSNGLLFWEIIKILRFVKPIIVHLITIKPVLIGGLAVRLCNIPSVVYSVSGLGYMFINNKTFSSFRLKFIELAYRVSLKHKNSIVIFQNTSDLSLISKMTNLKPASIFLIKGGSGVNLNVYKYFPIPIGPPIVVLPARLLKDKGVIEFIEAVKILKEIKTVIDIKARFVLVGNIDIDNPSSLTKEEVDNFKNDNIVEFWGFNNKMVDVFHLSTIIVLPSYREGLPKVLIEAAAIGRPIVTTDVPGCRETVLDNITGLLVKVKDPKSLSEAILHLLENPQKISEMSLAARNYALKSFDINFVINDHLDIYSSLMNRKLLS